MKGDTVSRAERIHRLLTEAFAPSHLEVADESARHEGHVGARPEGETHYRVHIISEAFLGKNRVERQRMVNTLLKDEFDTGLHALSIRAGVQPGSE